jgi:hypothetical protein
MHSRGRLGLASVIPILGLLAYGLTRDPNAVESPLLERCRP